MMKVGSVFALAQKLLEISQAQVAAAWIGEKVFTGKEKTQEAAVGIAGFTLIELLIVIAIIGILAAIAIPNFISYRDKAFCSEVEGTAATMGSMLADYFSVPSRTSMKSFVVREDGVYELNDDGTEGQIIDSKAYCGFIKDVVEAVGGFFRRVGRYFKAVFKSIRSLTDGRPGIEFQLWFAPGKCRCPEDYRKKSPKWINNVDGSVSYKETVL